jgi:hypothetical protein
MNAGFFQVQRKRRKIHIERVGSNYSDHDSLLVLDLVGQLGWFSVLVPGSDHSFPVERNIHPPYLCSKDLENCATLLVHKIINEEVSYHMFKSKNSSQIILVRK